MNHHSQCERCGDSTMRAETAARVFCASCASIASTGARSSSELLFTLARPAHRERTTAEDLASLARPSERLSITPLLGFGSPKVIVPPRPRPRVATSLFAAAAVLFAGSTAALAWHAVGRDAAVTPRAPSEAETTPEAHPVASSPPIREAFPPALAPEAPLAELVPRPDAIAPEPIDPRPTARAPRVSRPRVTAPAPRTDEGDVLDDLLGPAPASAVTSSAPRVPTRRDVSLAMRALEDEVAMCGGASGATVTARVTFVGPSGRVAYAEVVDASTPPAVRSCIARAVRAAELPEFAQDRFTVAYPFRL